MKLLKMIIYSKWIEFIPYDVVVSNEVSRDSEPFECQYEAIFVKEHPRNFEISSNCFEAQEFVSWHFCMPEGNYHGFELELRMN